MKLVSKLFLVFLLTTTFSGCATINKQEMSLHTVEDLAWKVDGEKIGDRENVKMENGFGAQLWLTDDQKIFNSWRNSFKLPKLNSIHTTVKNYPIYPFIVITNPGSNEENKNYVSYDIRIIKPDGNTYADIKNKKLWMNQKALPENVQQIAEEYVAIIIEDGDPLGKYSVETTIYDKVKNIKLSLHKDFNVYEIFSYPNGSKYIGEVSNGKRHGKGALIFPDGRKFEGTWANHELNGQGTATFPSGLKYSGEYIDDIPNGHGTLTLPNGDKYVGAFKNFELNGEGTFYGYSHGFVYTGHFEDGHWEGIGKLVDTENGFTYEGEFSQSLIEGTGTLTLPNGMKFSGEWNLVKIMEVVLKHK